MKWLLLCHFLFDTPTRTHKYWLFLTWVFSVFDLCTTSHCKISETLVTFVLLTNIDSNVLLKFPTEYTLFKLTAFAFNDFSIYWNKKSIKTNTLKRPKKQTQTLKLENSKGKSLMTMLLCRYFEALPSIVKYCRCKHKSITWVKSYDLSASSKAGNGFLKHSLIACN